MAKDLLFEIGTEEIPASFIPRALDALRESLTKKLASSRLAYGGVRTYGTPRRLAFLVTDLAERQDDAVVEVKGPSKKAAYDDAGNPTKVLEGFARAQGVAIADIKVKKTDKGEYACAVKELKGEAALNILPSVLSALVAEEVFPKSMRWASFDVSFARPIHWLTAVYGSDAVEFAYGPVKSGVFTMGHRFMGGRGEVKVDSACRYLDILNAANVIADPEERKRTIAEGIKKAAAEAGGGVLPDEGLLEEVAYLVEYPVVLRGSFAREFLELPRDVVVNAMREHQRYFSMVDANGALLPYFLTVANTKATDPAVVIKGNERVLRARLNDAKFYYEKDIKTPLASFAEKLKGVVFQARLGTSYEKVERFASLAMFIGAATGFCEPMKENEPVSDFLKAAAPAGADRKRLLGRAAMLAKADLTSGMVGEFPKLQGVMGKEYALRGKEAPEVAAAIFEHYQPTVSGGQLPASAAGAIISIADKLDTIVGCFGVGLIPTGAQDPYALRRQALGIIAILLDKEFRNVRLDGLIDKSVGLLKPKLTRDKNDVKKDVVEFFKERLRNQLMGQGLSFDAIDAVVSTPWFDLPDAVKRVRAIEAFKTHPASADLTVAFKRVSNILKGVEPGGAPPDAALFRDAEEKGLHAKAVEIAPAIKALCEAGDYKGALERLAAIKDAVDLFFDKVLVMAEDAAVRQNRLRLLDTVRGLYYNIADLSKLTA